MEVRKTFVLIMWNLDLRNYLKGKVDKEGNGAGNEQCTVKCIMEMS